MDRRERLADLDTALLAAFQGNQSGIWTAMPGVIESYDAAKMTVSVRPSIKAQVRNEDGTFEWVALPLLVDCPVIFPSGGGFSLTFPIAAGDECLVIFASRCIDSWWESGGIQIQPDFRMHDLSDGFALLGPRSQPRVLSPSASTSGVEVRNDARTAYVRIDGSADVTVHTSADVTVNAGGDVTVLAGGNLNATAAGNLSATASGSATVTAPTITLTGNVSVVGNLSVSGTLINDGTNIGKTHKHTGGTLSGGLTGVPT